MDGLILLQEARAAGLIVMVEGDRLRIRGPKRAEPVARRLIAHKAEVLAMAMIRHVHGLDGDLAEALAEAWEERIAICLEDGKVSRETAEEIALAQLRMMIEQARDGKPAGNAAGLTQGRLFTVEQESGPYGRV